MSQKPLHIGLLQALGLTTYVSAFAGAAQLFINWAKEHLIESPPVFNIMLFLLAFVTSAFICGTVMFLYPTLKFFEGKKTEALQVVLWSGLWLVVLAALVFSVGLLFFVPTK